jgi:H+-translocating NAD(P) transhydrogenase subunit alpha
MRVEHIGAIMLAGCLTAATLFAQTAPATSTATTPLVGPPKPVTATLTAPATVQKTPAQPATTQHTTAGESQLDYMSMVFVFMLATFIGVGVIRRVSRLLHTPLMSLTNAISAIAVVGAIIVAGGKNYPWGIRLLGSIALFCSMTNIISGFLITDRMLKMFKSREGGKA